MTTTHSTIQLRLDVVKVLRELRGLETDVQLAQAMGLNQSSLSRVFTGKSAPGPRFQAGLCLALEASLNDLFVVVGADELQRAA